MPYGTNGTYTPVPYAVTAAPGDIIRSAGWNSIGLDLAVALTDIRTGYEQSKSVQTITATLYTVGASDSALVFNVAGTATVTMPSAVTYPGRWLYVKTVQNQAVLSATSVVVPLATTTAGITLVGNTAGKFAQLKSDGTNWVIMAGT